MALLAAAAGRAADAVLQAADEEAAGGEPTLATMFRLADAREAAVREAVLVRTKHTTPPEECERVTKKARAEFDAEVDSFLHSNEAHVDVLHASLLRYAAQQQPPSKQRKAVELFFRHSDQLMRAFELFRVALLDQLSDPTSVLMCVRLRVRARSRSCLHLRDLLGYDSDEVALLIEGLCFACLDRKRGHLRDHPEAGLDFVQALTRSLDRRAHAVTAALEALLRSRGRHSSLLVGEYSDLCVVKPSVDQGQLLATCVGHPTQRFAFLPLGVAGLWRALRRPIEVDAERRTCNLLRNLRLCACFARDLFCFPLPTEHSGSDLEDLGLQRALWAWGVHRSALQAEGVQRLPSWEVLAREFGVTNVKVAHR